MQELNDIKTVGCNALCVYLGYFGPEISETLLAKHLDRPKMFVVAEESVADLLDGLGDAFLWYVKCKLQIETSQYPCLHSRVSGSNSRGM